MGDTDEELLTLEEKVGTTDLELEIQPEGVRLVDLVNDGEAVTLAVPQGVGEALGLVVGDCDLEGAKDQVAFAVMEGVIVAEAELLAL